MGKQPIPAPTREGRILQGMREVLGAKEAVEGVAAWAAALHREAEDVTARYLHLAALLSADHCTAPFVEAVGHFRASVGHLEGMCTDALGYVEGRALADLRARLARQRAAGSTPTAAGAAAGNVIPSAC
jgi:hypothetical protein